MPCRRQPEKKTLFNPVNNFYYRAALYLIIFACQLVGSSFSIRGIHDHTVKLKDSTKNVFIQVVTSKTKVYVGEAFTISYILYYSIPVIDPQNNIDYKFKDCYLEEYPVKEQDSIAVINGRSYHLVIIKKLLVIPQTEGILNVPAINMDLKINSPAAADDFFGGEKLVSKKISCKKKSIEVLPLPTKTESLVYSGAVGKFNLSSSFFLTDKPRNLFKIRLIISGKGNIKFTNLVAPQLPPGIEIADETNNEEHTLIGNGLNVKHTFSLDLVTIYKGHYTIPPITFLYFDPKILKYVKLTSPPYLWQVNTGALLPKSMIRTNAPLRNKVTDSLYNVINGDKIQTNGFFFNSSLYYIILIVTGLLFSSGIGYSYYIKKKKSDLAYYNYRTAFKHAFKNIKKLKSISFVTTDDIFCKSTMQIFRKYLSDVNYISLVDFSYDNIYNELQKQCISPDLLKNIFDFISKQNTIRFSVKKEEVMNRDEICSEMLQIIKDLDGLIKKHTI